MNVGFIWLHEAINPKSDIKKYIPYLFGVGMGLSTITTNAMALWLTHINQLIVANLGIAIFWLLILF